MYVRSQYARFFADFLQFLPLFLLAFRLVFKAYICIICDSIATDTTHAPDFHSVLAGRAFYISIICKPSQNTRHFRRFVRIFIVSTN